jgi:hypothetical protein
MCSSRPDDSPRIWGAQGSARRAVVDEKDYELLLFRGPDGGVDGHRAA